VRRAALALALGAALLAGCGTPSPDLFLVERSGADPNANLELVVSDGGSVRCNGEEHPLDTDRLLTARRLLREVEPQAELHLELPPGPRANLSYRVEMEKGTIAFSDTSAKIPQTFQQLAGFTKDVAERVCGIQR
jgi:hypothetical protein